MRAPVPDESLSLGLESGVARVVPHDPAWARLYEAEAARLAPVLAAHGATIVLEHTGSTAVPGIVAKPIIDILAGWTTEADRAAAVVALQAAGWTHRGEQGIPGRDYFRRGDPRSWHLHMVRTGSAFWRDHRDFRDWLRAHPDDAAAYGALKTALAERHRHDREAYIDGKTAFVLAILGKARAVGGGAGGDGA